MDLAARKRAWTGSVARPGDVAVLSNCEDDDSRRWVVDAALGASGASGVVTRLAYAAAGLALDALPADGDAAPAPRCAGSAPRARPAAALRSLLGPFVSGKFALPPEDDEGGDDSLLAAVADLALKAVDDRGDFGVALAACRASAHTIPVPERLAPSQTRLAVFVLDVAAKAFDGGNDVNLSTSAARCGDLKLFLPLRKLRDAAPRLDDADLDALAAPSDDLGVVDVDGPAERRRWRAQARGRAPTPSAPGRRGLWRARDASAALDAGRCAYVAKLALRGGDGGAVAAPPPGAEDAPRAARRRAPRPRGSSSAAGPSRTPRPPPTRPSPPLARRRARAPPGARTFDEGGGRRRRRRGATTPRPPRPGPRPRRRRAARGARRAASPSRRRPRARTTPRTSPPRPAAAGARRASPARSRRRSSRRRPSPTSATTTPGASSRPSSTTRTRTFEDLEIFGERGGGGVGGDALVVRAARLAAETTTGSGAVAAAAAARLALFRRAAPAAAAPAARHATRLARRSARRGLPRRRRGRRRGGAVPRRGVRPRPGRGDGGAGRGLRGRGPGVAAQLPAGAKAMALFDAAGAFLGAPRPAGDAADRARDEIFRAADAPDAERRGGARVPRRGRVAPPGDPPATSAYAALLVLKESDDDGDDDRPEAGGAWLPPPPGAVLLKYLKGRYRKESDARPLDLLCRLVVAHCGQADATFCRVAQEHGLLLRRFARATKALGRSFAGAVSPAEVYACAARREAFHALEGDAGDLERAAAERAAPLFARRRRTARPSAPAAFFENFGARASSPSGASPRGSRAASARPSSRGCGPSGRRSRRWASRRVRDRRRRRGDAARMAVTAGGDPALVDAARAAADALAAGGRAPTSCSRRSCCSRTPAPLALDEARGAAEARREAFANAAAALVLGPLFGDGRTATAR
ncbi:hypothetical protein JL720_13000 [Aureococcus anophagefferens]|nr:hypothetical protein JL720_13000 [Aureococcus anophagefferens]